MTAIAVRSDARDHGTALLLFTAALLYLSCLPYNLGNSDEAYFLVEAKRVARGEVMYRDVFEFIPPGAIYVMAGAFRVLGTTMTTARGVTNVLHGLIVVLLYLTARRLRVDRLLAAVVALAYLGLCQSAWPYASWHWFSSLLLVLQCWLLVHARWPATPRSVLWFGVVSGASIGMQHQRGIPVAVGVMVLLCLVHVIQRRDGTDSPSGLVRQLCTYAGGILLVMVPLMLPSVWLAGIDALVEGLIRFPIETYRPTFHTAWGAVGPLSKPYAPYTFPALLRLSPLVLAVIVVRGGVALRGGDRDTVNVLTVLTIVSLSAIASIWYYADFIHVAFIAPLFFVGIAATVQWLLSPLRRWPALAAVARLLIALACAVPILGQLRRNYALAWQTYRVPHDTAFGRIDFSSKWEPVLIDATRAALAAAPGAELFCYPTLAGPYLTADGKNPTRYQFLDARAQPRHYIETVAELLRRRRVQFLMIAYPYIRPDDPIALLLKSDYQAVPIPELPLTGEFPTMLLYRRKDTTGVSS